MLSEACSSVCGLTRRERDRPWRDLHLHSVLAERGPEKRLLMVFT